MLMDRIKNKDQLIKLNHDLTKSFECKIQCIWRKLKNRFSSKEYYKLYPRCLTPAKFYDTAEIHILPANGFIDNLSLSRLYQTLLLQVIIC